jgi:hypothetical protein
MQVGRATKRVSSAMALLLCTPLFAADLPEVKVAIENHRFVPDTVIAPVGVKFRLIVENRDATAEEFESYELNREKIVAARSSIVVFIGPLKAGAYEFFGDFNPKSARGRIVAK